MSHYHKKCYSAESDNHSDASSCDSNHKQSACNQRKACIICPPTDHQETYHTESSDYSCPNFSDLCDDLPRKDKKCNDESHDDEYSDSESDSEYCDDKKCGIDCGNACGNPCKGGKRIRPHRPVDDHSRGSVLNALGDSDDESCPNFDDLLEDCRRDCKKEEPKVVKQNSARGKKFVITYGPKAGHPWAEYNKGDNQSIHINGKNGPVLHLYRDCTYFFCVEQKHCESGDVHQFVLTNKPDGGKGSKIIPGGFEPVSKGCVSLKVTKSTPRYFYYQDADHSYEGGLVIVHDAADA
ncbi:MAG: hypothetical protein ABIQ41_12465 [Gemmatimonadales bacterium]